MYLDFVMNAVENGVTDDDSAAETDWAARVAGTMISPSTMLATDYLNHFNEVLMLLQMVPDMPDMLEDCKEWQPKSYPQHFLDSGLKDGVLAAEAYEHAPAAFKLPFEATITQMNSLVTNAVAALDLAMAANKPNEVIREQTPAVVSTLQVLNQLADSIIHGDTSTLNQSMIDQILAG